MDGESEQWSEFAEGYDSKIFSLTSFPERREQLMDRIKPGRILNMGAGSTTYLNIDLILMGSNVVASDFCQEMLKVAESKFTHADLEYVLADSTNFSFESNSFDSVVSVNSILPPERYLVDLMFKEAFRVLKPLGFFVAFLTSYDSAKRYEDIFGEDMLFDDRQLRVDDTSGWQCFHTPESIDQEIKNAGFNNYLCERVYLNTPAELLEMRRLYGLDTANLPIYEYLVAAKKF